jgi:hypothetical protein
MNKKQDVSFGVLLNGQGMPRLDIVFRKVSQRKVVQELAVLP